MSNRFYTSVEKVGNYIHHIGYDNGKKFKEKIQFKPTLFLPSKNTNSIFRDMFGEIVEPIKFDSISDKYEFLQKYQNIDGFSYSGMEDDRYQFISDTYQSDVDFDTNLIRIAHYDIEVETLAGFPNVDIADRMITAITIFCDDIYHIFGLKDYTEEADNERYYKYSDEESMLKGFVELWRNLDFDLITAWAGEQFDIPYTINRIKSVLGDKWAKKLSPIGIIKSKIVTNFEYGSQFNSYDILGLPFLDLMNVYKRFSVPREQYKLNYIAHVELDQEKIDYSEHETLNKLYQEDHQKYIRYNIRDVNLMVGIENKKKYLELMFNMAYTAKVMWVDVFKHTRLWDGIIYNFLKPQNIVIPKKPKYEKLAQAYSGGYVKDPIPNIYRWVVSLDATSLYPHIFMQYNISPETFKGKITVNFQDLVNGKDTGFGDMLRKENYALTASGALFSKDKKGFLPQLIEKMFALRKEAKDKMLDLDGKYQKIKDKLTNDQIKLIKNQIQKFDLQQLAFKSQLVACYGAFGQSAFRYYQVSIAEAITTSGRLALQWSERKMNEFLYNTTKITKAYILYGDTDSIWVNFEDIVKKYVPASFGLNKTADFLDEYIKVKVQPYLTDVFNELCDLTNGMASKLHFKREKICNVAVFKKKKRYFANVIDSEGVRYDPPSLKVTGMESIRTNISVIYRKAFHDLYDIICNKTNKDAIEYLEKFKPIFMNSEPKDIAIPKSMNDIDKYADHDTIYIKGATIQARSALLFNHYISKMKLDKKYEKIVNGEKIKTIYLKLPNPINENSIAFITTLPEEFGLEKYIDYETQWYKAFLKAVEDLFKIVGWNVKEQVDVASFFE